ncbi:MAG: SDR family oxidoreductase [Candidatus Yanofskybacteria bacterium]|nr:SDR family oxidoreductase [Candidatus Yanofskybacteria bacterium]
MAKKSMQVLVVGGAGYIGGSVTDILQARKIPFTVYDNLLYEQHYLKPVNFVSGDVRDTKKLKKLLPKYTHVIWLAAIVGDAACQIRPSLTAEVNRLSVQWLSKNFKGRIVFASTCSVYGENREEAFETTPPNPLSLYARTKLEAEKALKNSNAIIFRLGTVFGVSDNYSRLRMDLAVNYMTAHAATKGKLSIYGGNQWRPFIHVYNVAEIFVNALDKPEKGVYNVAAMNYKISDLGKEIARITKCKVEYADAKFEDLRSYFVNIEKGKKAGLFKFKTMFPIAHGVKQISELISSGKIKYTTADIYYNERHILNLQNEDRLK